MPILGILPGICIFLHDSDPQRVSAISIHILSPEYKTQNDIVAMLPLNKKHLYRLIQLHRIFQLW